MASTDQKPSSQSQQPRVAFAAVGGASPMETVPVKEGVSSSLKPPSSRPQVASADGIKLSRAPVVRKVATAKGAENVEAFCFTFRGVEFFIHRQLARPGAGNIFDNERRWKCSHGPTGLLVSHNPGRLKSLEALMRQTCDKLANVWDRMPTITAGKTIVNP